MTLAQSPEGETSIDWSSQSEATGPSVRYDLVDGQLSDLLAAGDFSGAGCLFSQTGEPPVIDPGLVPPPGDGRYFLVRARNSCGAGTFGSGHLDPDPRAGLEDGDTSPPAPDRCP